MDGTNIGPNLSHPELPPFLFITLSEPTPATGSTLCLSVFAFEYGFQRKAYGRPEGLGGGTEPPWYLAHHTLLVHPTPTPDLERLSGSQGCSVGQWSLWRQREHSRGTDRGCKSGCCVLLISQLGAPVTRHVIIMLIIV